MTVEIECVNRHLARLQLDVFPCPRQVVGTLAVDLQRRKSRRHLLDRAGKAVEHASHRSQRREAVRARDDLALCIERVGLLAELDREDIGLGRIEHAARQLGRLAQSDRQHAFGQRVERAAMTDLGLGIAAFAQGSLHRADALGRTHSARLVEHDPARGRHLLVFVVHETPPSQSVPDRPIA